MTRLPPLTSTRLPTEAGTGRPERLAQPQRTPAASAMAHVRRSLRLGALARLPRKDFHPQARNSLSEHTMMSSYQARPYAATPYAHPAGSRHICYRNREANETRVVR